MNLAPKEKVEGCKCKPCSMEDIEYFMAGTTYEMVELMRRERGIGLAAPQVGIFKRFFIMKYGNDYIQVFNPKILSQSDKKTVLKESCLTYPAPRPKGILTRPEAKMLRSKTVKVEFQNHSGEYVTLKLRGTEARCFLHEYDHLEGLTIFFRGKNG